MDPILLCQGKGLVLPNLSIDETAQHVRFLLISLPNNAMSVQSPFTIHKALKGIGGEPKSVKRLRSGDLLVETSSSTHTKSFLLAKTFLNSPVNIIPHKSLNTSRGVISEPDLLATSEAEILGRILQSIHHSDLKKPASDESTSDEEEMIVYDVEDEIESNPDYVKEMFSQTYAQVAKPSIATSTTQTDENITKVKCPPLQILKPLVSVPHPNASPSITSNSTSSSTTQVNLLPSASSIKPTTQTESRLPEPISSAAAPDNSLNTSASSLSTETRLLNTSNKFAALSTEILSLVPQVHLLPSTSTVATVSEPQPPNPTSNDTPSITNTHQMKTMFTP
ncbi:uncharacterized protein TNCV_748591, partial [Trichonephila clavipes]